MKKLALTLTIFFVLSCSTIESILKESGRFIRIEPARIQLGKSGEPESTKDSDKTYSLVLPAHIHMLDTFDTGDQLIIKQTDVMERVSKGQLFLTFTDTVAHFDPERFIEYKKVFIRKIPVKHQKMNR